MLMDQLRGFLWRLYLIMWGARVGRNFKVHGSLDILTRDGATLRNVSIGDNVSVGGKLYLRMRKNGRITIKNGASVGTEVWLVTANDAELSVGENSALSSYSIFNGGHGITIGADCVFAGFVYVNSSEHGSKKNEIIRKQGYYGSPVVIGNDVWLGGHVTVTQGVTLGDGAVIGANAVVTRDIPPYAIAIGSPAKVLKYRE
jgi:acetyltransferase-like isoleucine patch superfamily enzyme